MVKFQEWLKIRENLWGNIPVKGKKPSDGWSQANYSVSPQPKMMKKMKKK